MNLREHPVVQESLSESLPFVPKFKDPGTYDFELSVIIPVWIHSRSQTMGEECLLEITRRCVWSILESTSAHHSEIILIDNGSVEEAAKALRLIPGIRYVRNEKNLGCAVSWNQGIGMAGGKYIALVNNDTLASPGWDGTLISAMEANPKVAACGPAALNRGMDKWPELHYTDKATVMTTDEEAPRGGYQRVHGEYSKRYDGYFDCALRASWMLLNRRVLEEVGGFHSGFIGGGYEDSEWMYRVLLGDWIFLCPHKATFYHYMGKSTTSAHSLLECYDKNGALFKEIWPDSTKDLVYNDWMTRQVTMKDKIRLPWRKDGGYHA